MARCAGFDAAPLITPPKGARRAGAALALGVLAAALALGWVTVQHYGLAHDQVLQQRVGQFTVDYVLGENTRLLEQDLRYYGAAFELVLLGVQRSLGLTDSHDVYLSRYFVTHCFFLAGAFACYLLACRLFGSRALALLAMLFFLCHPRIYAHSFFNSKDAPFLSMFMIALLLADWALRRGREGGGGAAVGPFAALGAWIGLIGSIRPMAFMLLALVALARCADVGASRRRLARLVASGAALTVAAGAGFFAGLPYLWADPLARLAEWFALATDHPTEVQSLFLGELIRTDERPVAYVPVWMVITTPPVVTVLALLGGIGICVRLATSMRKTLGDASARFKALLAACVLITVVVVTLWVGNIYNGWRHLHFLYGPLCLGAAGGLAWLRRNAGRRLAVLGGAVACLGVVPAVAWTARLHPHEHVYFNFLVDRKTPERLRAQFDMDYWAVSYKEALERLLDALPGRVHVAGLVEQSIALLAPVRRLRVERSSDFAAYFITDYRDWFGGGPDIGRTYVHPVHVRRVFGSTLYALARLEVATEEESGYRADYRAAVAVRPLLVDRFSVHWAGGALTYLREDCEPADVEGWMFNLFDLPPPRGRFFLRVLGDEKDAPASRGRYYHNKDFQFYNRGVVFREGASRVCMARVDLRGFEVDGIRTGQMGTGPAPLWSHTVNMVDRARFRRALARARNRAPARRGVFDVHRDEDALVYVKEGCAEGDWAARFFLHMVPFDFDQMPRSVARLGFVNRDFTFATHGAVLDGACVALARLPPFRARGARTGQFVDAEGELWRVALDLTQPP